jgi:hypothetical protein
MASSSRGSVVSSSGRSGRALDGAGARSDNDTALYIGSGRRIKPSDRSTAPRSRLVYKMDPSNIQTMDKGLPVLSSNAES